MTFARLVCLVSLISVIAACGSEPPPTASEPLGSRLELVAGDVWQVTDSENQRLITGAMLPGTATIKVGDGGRALIRLGSGSGIFLRSGTVLKINHNDVALVKGELWADVPTGEDEMGHFTAGKVNVTASDAGLDIAAYDDEVRVYVSRGLAVVAAPGGRSELQNGEKITIKGDEKPEVEPVDFWEDWTGGMADRELMAGLGGKASGRIFGVNRSRPGSTPERLQITSSKVKILIRDGIAYTTVDQRFFNPSSTALEGWYWFTVPEGASVDRFALEVNGSLVDGEMIERKQAAAAYENAIRRAFDPALLEWIDERTFRARIYPIPATGERRVVLAYSQLIPLSDGAYRYVYPMGSSSDEQIAEFSLNVTLPDNEQFDIATLQDARVSADNSSVSMRRSGFSPKADFLLELKPKEMPSPLRAMRYSTDKNEADYLMLRYSPEVNWDELKEVPGDVVVVLDTSAGGDESERQIRTDAVEAILRALSKGDRFAVVATDLTPRVLYPAQGLANASEENVSNAMERLSEISSAGATDLGEMFSVALNLLHEGQQPAVIYVGDGRPTVGETSSSDLSDRLRRALGDSRARLFTIAVGADADYSLLERLARIGGGRLFRIDTAEQTVQEALRFVGIVKTPTITDLEIEAGSGLDQVFSNAGKISKGEEVVLLARSHHDLPDEITIKGKLGNKSFTNSYKPKIEKGKHLGYLPVLWARKNLERLMGEGLELSKGRIIALGLNYALMTPFTSFLVLESDAAYESQGIKRRQVHQLSRAIARPTPKNNRNLSGAAAVPLLLFGCAEARSEDGEAAAMEKSAPAPGSASTPAPQLNASKDQPKLEESKSVSDGDDRLESMQKKIDALGAGGDVKGVMTAPQRADRDYGKGARGRMATKARRSKPSPSSTAAQIEKEEDESEPDVGNLSLIATGNPYKDIATNKTSIFKKGICSDASRQPLTHRRILWNKRVARITDAHQLFRFFFEAGEHCELPTWRHRKVLLDLLESHARTGDQVQTLLNSFNRYKRIQKYLRHRILRRNLDPDMMVNLYSTADWASVVRGLAAIEKIEDRIIELKKIIEQHPADPIGRQLLVGLLLEAEKIPEAMAEASRLRRDGLAGPAVLQTLCDLQAEAGLIEEARRTCSELVEFNPDDPKARHTLGDLFIRHGWYDAAYRQYHSLVTMMEDNPLALLRLAAAAAGMGKIDEALRIERKVSSGDGQPGPNDPRRWARLHSAIRLAKMLIDSRKEKNKDKTRAIERSLKRTGVFGSGATLVLMTWEDFQTNLVLSATKLDEEKTPFPVSERILSPQTGLVMFDIGMAKTNEINFSVKLAGNPIRRAIPFSMYTIKWDGKNFTIDKKDHKLEAKSEKLDLYEQS